jgi:hypothetical protein
MKPATFDARGTECDLMIVGSFVLVANDEQQLYCVDLATGSQRWTRRRGDTKYAAAIGDDRLLVIGEQRLTAISISDGRYLWPNAEFIATPGGGAPTGRGLFDGKYFYLPTSDPEIVKIDVGNGMVVDRLKTDEPLGNLLVHGGLVIAQNESKLVSFAPSDHQPAAAEETAHPVLDVSSMTPGELIDALKSGAFTHRQHASQELLRRGPEALPALAAGIQSTDPEMAFRCTSVLIRLLDSADSAVAGHARSILRAAANSATPIAANAFAREASWRSKKAISEIERLGGTVQPHRKSVVLGQSWRGGNAAIAELIWLRELESLELCHSSIDDSGLAHLQEIPRLKTLNLRRSAVTSGGLRQLTGIPKLETLLLQGTQIDDSAVEPLAMLKQVKAMNLLQTKMTAAAVERLRLQLPQVNILN